MDKICYTLIAFKFWYKDKIRIVTIQAAETCSHELLTY